MVEIIRNILAFISTFVSIAALVMIVLHGLIAVICKNKEMSNRQDRYVVFTGIAVALILIPFYYLPA